MGRRKGWEIMPYPFSYSKLERAEFKGNYKRLQRMRRKTLRRRGLKRKGLKNKKNL